MAPSSLSTHRSPPRRSFIGRTVEKEFVVPGTRKKRKKLYRGKVVSYDSGQFIVRYEDDDEERIDWDELQSILVVADDENNCARVVTPPKEEDQDEPSSSLEEEDSSSCLDSASEYEEKEDDSSSSDDEDSYQQEEDNRSKVSPKKVNRTLFVHAEEQEDRKPPAKKTRNTARSNNKTRKQPLPKKKPPPSKHHDSVMPHRSVAAVGLPVGARAVGRGGFEVRSLDGVQPQVTKDVLQKAIQLVQQGEHQAAANLCKMDEHDSIRAFCRAACTKLGIETPANLKGGSELSAKALARLEEGTKGVQGDLPGRLLVVRVGTAICDDSGKPLVPLDLADFVGTAEELHEVMDEPLATYAMQVAGDPAFGPWNVMQQRLDSAGLLPNDENNHRPLPFMVTVDWEGGDSLPTGSWGIYSSGKMDSSNEHQWALIEGATREAPSVILGVSPSLLVTLSLDDCNDNERQTVVRTSNLLPALSSEVEQLRLPASLLQKAIRRNFCSPVPLLEACSRLLRGCSLGEEQGDKRAPRGGVFELLCTTWRGMLEDASPFEAPNDGSMLGFEQLLLLSLVAAAEPSWSLPMPLMRKTIATVVRTQNQPANFNSIERTSDSSEQNWNLSDSGSQLQNALQIMRAAVGGKIVRRSSLEKSGSIEESEAVLVDHFVAGTVPPVPEGRLQSLDIECRLASYDPGVSASCLLVMQALLPEPPVSWKKHSLPSIAKQVKTLIVNVNARMVDHHNLTRLAAWGNNRVTAPVVAAPRDKDTLKDCESAREVVTSTGVLSPKEHEILDCFEAVQRWREKEIELSQQGKPKSPASTDLEAPFARTQVGAAPTEYDGRIAFLLAFARSEEIEVCPSGGKPEVVNVLFCGDKDEPLLVQRIGKARKESATAMAGPESGSTGAKSVPSLGYVVRSRSQNDRLLVEAAESALEERWEDGRVVSLPLPPPGFQWNLPNVKPGQEDEAERAVKLTAALDTLGKWKFSICGVDVEPFDARQVISPCSLGTQNHSPVPLGREREDLLRVAFYHRTDTSPASVLNTLVDLHELAAEARNQGANEGTVYDWLSLASTGGISSTVWRDAILALKTREKDDVRMGPVSPDGTCSRDMTEGSLLRIFYVLESLYPSALIKSGALKWRVRSRGAGFYHMMDCLEQLSRGVFTLSAISDSKTTSTTRTAEVPKKSTGSEKRSRRRSKRLAAEVCASAVASMAAMEADADSVGNDVPDRDGTGWSPQEDEYLPLPRVTTKLWPHQEASVSKVVEGIKQGRRGHADASAVGAGKTLTALATIVRLAAYMEETQGKRNGVLVMLPTTALVKEWLLQIAEHTHGFHTVEQRESGQLFSLTYGKSSPPIDGNTIVISTLDRVAKHPFVRQAAWDFVIIDECLSVQNADAKRVPSAWRQIEISALGVLMLSATFFRSKYSDLFYMIRMLRTAFPRSMEWLSATIHEHIVCQVPETDRTWQMIGKPVALRPTDLSDYRGIIEAFKRKQLNNADKSLDFRRLFVDLEAFLRSKYEGRETRTSYHPTSVMGEACVDACNTLLMEGYRPLVFADTSNEAEHLQGVLRSSGLNSRKWAEVARDNISSANRNLDEQSVLVAVKSVEGQGINMQHSADAIVCRPTPGDHLEQMKGRIDRPGQMTKKLKLVVLMAEHTIEEAKFANIHLAGNFFREYIAPVATRYRERIDLEATLAAGGTSKLKRGTVTSAWRRSLDAAGRSGAFARITPVLTQNDDGNSCSENEVEPRALKRSRGSDGKALATKTATVQPDNEPIMFAPLNKVFRNKGDPEAIRQAKAAARNGRASLAVRSWLFPPKKPTARKGLPKESFKRFSDAKPPAVLDREHVDKAVEHLSKDPKLGALISRVGADALVADRDSSRRAKRPKKLTQEAFCDCCLRSITFTMVSVDAGNAFLRRLAMKIGVGIENMIPAKREKLLTATVEEMQEGGDSHDDLSSEGLLDMLLEGKTGGLIFTPKLLGVLIEDCLIIKGEQTGYPHLCGVTHPCGKNDDHSLFLSKARDHLAGDKPVSAGYSKSKADFIIALVDDMNSGKVTADKIAKASDREAAKMLRGLKGIGDWCVGVILMHFLKRSDIMLYGDLTVRNCLNDIYDISHNVKSETMVDSVTDFPDNAENRNLIDALSQKNGWEPYRTVVCLLMYHLQEENLVLL